MVREATRSEISLAVATRLTRDHEDVDKGRGKGKGRNMKNDPAASLQVLKTVMPQRLRLSFNS